MAILNGKRLFFSPKISIVGASGSVEITENGTHNVKDYAEAVVNVEGGGGIEQFRAFIEGNHENVVIPEGVTKIKPYAFCEGDGYNDYSLIETVTLPSTLKEIGNHAFGYNSCLYDLILPEGLEDIGDYAFCGNCFEVDFVIPSTVKRIGRDIFTDSFGSIGTVILKGKPTEIKSTAFSSIYGLTIKVPFSEGEVAGAPWGAESATIIYEWTEE